ncbi:MAG: hypothetical protein ABH823_03120, partial [bacterium]
MDAWRLIATPHLSGSVNMQTDLKMMADFEAGLISSTLRIYSWQPRCISYGYGQKMERWKDGKMEGWEVVKRPTGGGIVFHNEAEVTYSLVASLDNPILPKGLVPSYKKISDAVIVALRKVGVLAAVLDSRAVPAGRQVRGNDKSALCFSYPAEYEIVCQGRKIVGSAQKRG